MEAKPRKINLSKFNLEFNAILVYGLRLAGAALTLGLQIFLARFLQAYEYGLFAFTWSCLIILGEFLSFGFYNLIQRLIPEYRINNQPALLRGAVWGAAITILLSSLAITILIWAGLYGLVQAQLISSVYADLLIIGALSLPAFALADYLSGIGRSYGWMIRAFAPTALFRPLAIMGLFVGTIAFGVSSSALTAITCATIAIWITLLLSFLIISKAMPDKDYQGSRDYKFRPWILAALPMMMISSFELLLFNIDVLMISLFLSPDQTGLYFAATKIMVLVAFLNFSVGSAFTASYANHYLKNNHEALAKSIRRSASLTFYPSLLMITGIILFKDELLSLFGPGFEQASYVIFPLSIGLICRALVGPGERILMMTGKHFTCGAIYLGTVIIDIILNIILIPHYGLLGAAIATSVSFVLMALLLFIMVRKHLSVTALASAPQDLLPSSQAG